MLFSLLLLTFVLIIAMVIAYAMYEQYVMIQIINAKGVEEKIELPKPKIVKVAKKEKKRKETPEEKAKREAIEANAKRLNTIIANIDAYNGTSEGQMEVK